MQKYKTSATHSSHNRPQSHSSRGNNVGERGKITGKSENKRNETNNNPQIDTLDNKNIEEGKEQADKNTDNQTTDGHQQKTPKESKSTEGNKEDAKVEKRDTWVTVTK